MNRNYIFNFNDVLGIVKGKYFIYHQKFLRIEYFCVKIFLKLP
jgi:hypothetical protein